LTSQQCPICSFKPSLYQPSQGSAIGSTRKNPSYMNFLDLYHSCLVLGVGIAFKRQELDAAAAPGYCVILPTAVSSLPAQPRCHQWALCGERRIVQFRRALHDVCSSSTLVAITVSINTSTKSTCDQRKKERKGLDACDEEANGGTNQQNRT
jgi:hypothetical protein